MSETLELIHRWNHTYSILSTCAFPNKKLLFAGTQDSKILVFDITNYNLIKTLCLGELKETNTRSSVLCLDKSKDEVYLFSAGADSLVRIWTIGDVTKDCDTSVEIKELATVYSVTDIGDIFSIRYIDSLETLVFGCQNASLLYLDNIFKRLHGMHSNSGIHANRLPHRRYDKFFDSYGPTGSASPPLKESLVDLSLKEDDPIFSNSILEIPAKNIINYAHNGFIYTISKLGSQFNEIFELEWMDSQQESSQTREYIVSGGGDGVSKIWSLDMATDGTIECYFCTEMESDDPILSQDVEFPFLYCGISDGIINIWDLSTKQLVSTLSTPTKSDIISLSVYNDYIFAINESGITLFHKTQLEHINANQGKMLSSGIFERIANDGKIYPNLLTGGNDGSLTLWNLPHPFTGKELSIADAANNKIDLEQSENVNTENMLKTMKDLISFETISQTSQGTNYQLPSRRCAIYLQRLFCRSGASKVKLLPISDSLNPVVIATFKRNSNSVPGKRIIWYGHYDVIPAGDRQRWNTDPFLLTCENGYMKGRGVSDNKGPLVSAIHTVSTLYQQKKLANDIVFLIEGNEEIGSPKFSEICLKYKDLIGDNIDWIMLSNSTWVDRIHPCLNYGLRGVINARIRVHSDELESHSGVSGGILREPTSDLINLISQLKDGKDSIKIPNFYSNLNNISDEEGARFKEVSQVANMEKYGSVEELITNWTKPSLSITTLTTSGSGNITVIPRSATIGLSIRLVPRQSVDEVKNDLSDYLNNCFAKLGSSNHLEIDILNTAEPWLGDPKNHAYQVLREELRKAWGIEPLFVREGGSIPCIRTLERIFDAPAVQIPCGQSTDNAHLDNENLRIKNFSNMAEILYNVFNRL